MNSTHKEIKAALITYHMAYNYGSALQAYATLLALQEIIPDTEIINYRMKEQKRYYSNLRLKYGLKNLRNDLLQFPIINKRIIRGIKFEQFGIDYLKLAEALTEPEEINRMWNKYDIIVSGSDQIWNKQSCELKRNDIKYMMPYLLEGYNGRKISYASSVGDASDKELRFISNHIKDFYSVALREEETAIRLAAISGREIQVVLDPTFLVKRDEWISLFNLNKEESSNFILYYSLGGYQEVAKQHKILESISKRYNMDVKVITPYVYYPSIAKNFINCAEYGPIDFLNALYNAKLIITNSYHGTILSLNLGKQVYSYCNGKVGDYRKKYILEKLGALRSIVSSDIDIDKICDIVDYAVVDPLIEKNRFESKEYILKACSL